MIYEMKDCVHSKACKQLAYFRSDGNTRIFYCSPKCKYYVCGSKVYKYFIEDAEAKAIAFLIQNQLWIFEKRIKEEISNKIDACNDFCFPNKQEILEIIKREGEKAEAEIDELNENFDRQFKTLNEIIGEYKKPWE